MPACRLAVLRHTDTTACANLTQVECSSGLNRNGDHAQYVLNLRHIFFKSFGELLEHALQRIENPGAALLREKRAAGSQHGGGRPLGGGTTGNSQCTQQER